MVTKLGHITMTLNQEYRSGSAADLIICLVMLLGACDSQESWQSERNRHQPPIQEVRHTKTDPTALLSPQTLLRADEAFNARKMTEAVSHMSKRVLLVEKSSDVPAISGRETVRQSLQEFVKVFPDAKLMPLRILSGANWVLSETHFSGSQAQDINSLKNQKRHFDVRGAKLHRVQNGSVVETRIYMDTPTVIKQLRPPPGLTIQRAEKPSTQPEIISDPPSPRLEGRLRDFVKAWYLRDAEGLSSVSAQDIKYYNHLWNRKGVGASHLVAHGSPMLWVTGTVSTEVTSTFSTGEWAIAEVRVTASLDPTTEAKTPKKIRGSHLVLARFEQDRVIETHVYGSTLKVRQARFGPKLFPGGPSKNQPFYRNRPFAEDAGP